MYSDSACPHKPTSLKLISYDITSYTQINILGKTWRVLECCYELSALVIPSEIYVCDSGQRLLISFIEPEPLYSI